MGRATLETPVKPKNKEPVFPADKYWVYVDKNKNVVVTVARVYHSPKTKRLEKLMRVKDSKEREGLLKASLKGLGIKPRDDNLITLVQMFKLKETGDRIDSYLVSQALHLDRVIVTNKYPDAIEDKEIKPIKRPLFVYVGKWTEVFLEPLKSKDVPSFVPDALKKGKMQKPIKVIDVAKKSFLGAVALACSDDDWNVEIKSRDIDHEERVVYVKTANKFSSKPRVSMPISIAEFLDSITPKVNKKHNIGLALCADIEDPIELEKLVSQKTAVPLKLVKAPSTLKKAFNLDKPQGIMKFFNMAVYSSLHDEVRGATSNERKMFISCVGVLEDKRTRKPMFFVVVTVLKPMPGVKMDDVVIGIPLEKLSVFPVFVLKER